MSKTKGGLLGSAAPPPSPIGRALSITEFCLVEGISRSAYYLMKDRGEGPDETHVGARRTINPEAHRRWRKRRTRKASKRAPTFKHCEDKEPVATP
jgi:hypothetical protein